jgi:hypothetical protein
MIEYLKIDVTFDYKFDKWIFIGSTIRGSLGYALKNIVCINPKRVCEGCFVSNKCLYFDFYEKKNSFHNYRFEVNFKQNNYDFSIYLYNNLDELPYLLSAIHKMATDVGFSKDRVKIDIKTIQINDVDVYMDNNFHISNIKPKIVTISEDDREIKKDLMLIFDTPLRIKHNNLFAKNDIDLEHIINSIHKRYSELSGLEKSKSRPISYDNITKSIRFFELQRFSNRQNTSMQIGGIMGYMEIKNFDINGYNLLKIGEIIGVGKQTVFGLGKIRIEDR